MLAPARTLRGTSPYADLLLWKIAAPRASDIIPFITEAIGGVYCLRYVTADTIIFLVISGDEPRGETGAAIVAVAAPCGNEHRAGQHWILLLIYGADPEERRVNRGFLQTWRTDALLPVTRSRFPFIIDGCQAAIPDGFDLINKAAKK